MGVESVPVCWLLPASESTEGKDRQANESIERTFKHKSAEVHASLKLLRKTEQTKILLYNYILYI